MQGPKTDQKRTHSERSIHQNEALNVLKIFLPCLNQPASNHDKCKQTASNNVRTLAAAGSTVGLHRSTGSPVQSAPVTSHTV